MPYGDGIERIDCFSLTDFYDFERCPFRFFVKHHLGKKYDIEAASEAMALGILLDLAIKKFHSSKAYGQPAAYLRNLVMAAFNEVCDKVAKNSGASFYSAIMPFLTDELLHKATEIFITYYSALDFKIKQSFAEVGFCEWIIQTEGRVFKLWGGPDCFEMGEDGIPEIVDYKSREDVEKGKDNMDMDLMPKLYTLLCCKKLQQLGYAKARFVVRFWQDPLEDSFYEEFELSDVKSLELIFKQKIDQIVNTIEVKFCESPYCSGCKHADKNKFLHELEKQGIKYLSPTVVHEGDVSLGSALSS